MSPYIGAIVVDEDRHVPQHPHIVRGTVDTQRGPLFAEEELDGLLDRQLATMAVQQGSQRVMLSLGILHWPVVPAYVTVHAAQHIEQGVVWQPRNIVQA